MILDIPAMPRLARLDAPGILHHVMGRGIERKETFYNETDRNDFIDRLEIISNMFAKSTIFHYFKSKEGILLALFENLLPSATSKLLLIVKNKQLSATEKQ